MHVAAEFLTPGTYVQPWKTDRFLVPFRPGALFSVASYLCPGLSP